MRRSTTMSSDVTRCAEAEQNACWCVRSSVSERYVRNIAARDRFPHSVVGGNTAMNAAASLLVAGLVWAGAA
jgi:hypothetical protein